MSRTTRCRIAAFLVLGLVLTSLPARVWLFGACPVCGQIHVPILVAYVGPAPADPTPNSEPDDDPPASPHDGQLFHTCTPPLPYCPSAAAEVPGTILLAAGELKPQSDPQAALVAVSAIIRPPRA